MNKGFTVDNIFNSPLEIGLRCLIILKTFNDRVLNIQDIINLDYLTLHLKDFNEDLESVHPDIPYRSGEISVKRIVCQRGLQLMLSKGLITKNFNEKGICYEITSIGTLFVDYISNSYHVKLQEFCLMLYKEVGSMTEEQINEYITSNINEWGSEFINDSYLDDYLKL